MIKISSTLIVLFLSFLFVGCFKGEGKVRIASDKEDMILYINGNKKATVGKTYTDILLSEGDYEIKVEKVIDDGEWKYIGIKQVFVGENTSTKITIDTKKIATKQREERMAKEKKILEEKFPRISKNIIYDKKTGLHWQDNSSSKKVLKKWNDAKQYCQNLSLDGKNDWRLPNYEELLSIVDYGQYNPSVIPVFENISESSYWSSSDYKTTGIGFYKDGRYIYAWNIDFYSGATFANGKGVVKYVRCVRD